LLFFRRSDVLNIFSPIACILATRDGARIADNVGFIPKPPRTTVPSALVTSRLVAAIFSSADNFAKSFGLIMLPASSIGGDVDKPAVSNSEVVKSLPGVTPRLTALKALAAKPKVKSLKKPIAASLPTSPAISLMSCF